MKTNNITILFAFLLAWLPNAHSAPDEPGIDLGFVPDYIDFSFDDRYMVAENDFRYQVWDLDTHTKILDNEHPFKLGRMLKSNVVPTGSGYFLFGSEQVFMTVDYQNNSTEVKAYDLKNGQRLWETDQLHMAISLAETLMRVHAMDIVSVEAADGTRLNPQYAVGNFFTRNKMLDRLINYVPEKQALFFNGKHGLQAVDIRSGKMLWTAEEVKGGIGELIYNAPTQQLLVIKVPNSEGAIDQLTAHTEVQALDANSGTLQWSVDYTGDFIPGYASVIGNTLVLPYLELAFIDLENGVERNGDIKSRMEGATKTVKGLKGLMAIDNALGGDFGKEETSAKYDRLVPRNLHVDNDGKLCYFTTFNKDGKIGNGGKKGFLKIDIHQDKVLQETFNLLGDSWTPIQDEMVDGIFYVKASGNMNRTVIKAIDADSGDERFETEKAKNSADVAKMFNPFLIANGRIIDIVSKGIYTLDAKTGKEISYTTTKDLGVGTVVFSHFFEEGVLIFGTKGVGIMDYEGKVMLAVEAKNVKDFAANTKEVLLLENKKFTRIDLRGKKVAETVHFKNRESVVFSPSGKHVMKVNAKGDKIEQYN